MVLPFSSFCYEKDPTKLLTHWPRWFKVSGPMFASSFAFLFPFTIRTPKLTEIASFDVYKLDFVFFPVNHSQLLFVFHEGIETLPLSNRSNNKSS